MARPSAELHPSSCISTSRKRPRDDADLLELDASYSSSWSWRTPGSLPVVLPTSWSGVLSRKRTKTLDAEGDSNTQCSSTGTLADATASADEADASHDNPATLSMARPPAPVAPISPVVCVAPVDIAAPGLKALLDGGGVSSTSSSSSSGIKLSDEGSGVPPLVRLIGHQAVVRCPPGLSNYRSNETETDSDSDDGDLSPRTIGAVVQSPRDLPASMVLCSPRGEPMTMASPRELAPMHKALQHLRLEERSAFALERHPRSFKSVGGLFGLSISRALS